jgi:hypothetical protein
MAINIYSGGSSGAQKKSTGVKTSSVAERAKATTSAVSGDAQASNSGSTAVKSTGILGKIGSLVNKVAGVAKYVPGVVGNVAGVVEKITSANDPEWWQHVPGDGLSCNAPLSTVTSGDYTVGSNSYKLCNMRPAILEFQSSQFRSDGGYNVPHVMMCDERMITQYVMPAVRKVANAITLQSAADYKTALELQATMYAMWVNLKKYDYYLKQGLPFMPNQNTKAFPILQVENASWLQSTIARLEEYLHSHVRLPHTLCEYLNWRYGYTFRMRMTAKSGLVWYNITPITAAISDSDSIYSYQTIIDNIQNELSSSEGIQKAVSDLYNAYIDHDQSVTHDATRDMIYDSKEFCLRTNLDLGPSSTIWTGIDENVIIIDSNLDNQTVFMASTISTTSGSDFPLFPVFSANAYAHIGKEFNLHSTTMNIGAVASNEDWDYGRWDALGLDYYWYRMQILPAVAALTDNQDIRSVYAMATTAMACNFYNVGCFVAAYSNSSTAFTTSYYDITQVPYDAANVSDIVIQNEQIMAFANLVSESNKDITTYKQVEKRVAKDVANFVEQNDVAALATK